MKRILLFVLALLLSASTVLAMRVEEQKVKYVVHTVKCGETLWTICSTYMDKYHDKRDIREVMYEVTPINSGYVYVGQKLTLRLVDERGKD